MAKENEEILCDGLFMDGYIVPETLPQERVYELLAKMETGDKKSKEELAKHNIRLVLYEVTHRFQSVEYDKKDLVAIGNIGLMKALTTFDKTKKVKFSTYATRCVDNEILLFLRSLKKNQNVDSLNKVVKKDENGNEMTIEDTLMDKTDIIKEYEEKDTYRIIRQLVSELPKQEREIVKLYFGFSSDVHTQKEIANKLSIAQASVSNKIAKVVRNIGNQLQQIGIIELKTKDNKMTYEEETQKEDINLEMYKYFNQYTKEQTNEMLKGLTKEELIQLKQRIESKSKNNHKCIKKQKAI